jgi:hypothetical protein
MESFTGYRKVKSEFIKRLIEETSWENESQRKYINNLVRLENYILKGTKGKAGAMRYERLKAKHHWEWKRIFQELNPEEFERVKNKQRLEDEKLAQYVEVTMKESVNREKRLKQEWLMMGGKE